MTFEQDITSKGGLQFFGSISASISHEIKNVLAVLNENAGLLEDLALMSEKGVPLNNERIRALSGSIKNQIKRADLITKNMNSFAHSVDEPLRRVEIHEILELIVALMKRMADMREVKLELEDFLDHMSILTNPFFLENLVYYFIDYAIKSAGKDRTVSISVQKNGKLIIIKFSNLQGLMNDASEEFPTEREALLADLLSADIAIDRTAGNITISIPDNID